MSFSLRTLLSLSLSLTLQSAVLLSNAHAVTGEGGVIGNGENVVRNERGEYVNADLYFKARNYKLPDYYLEKLDLSKDKAFVKELSIVLMVLDTRNGGHTVYDLKRIQDFLGKYEFYSVSKFSGDESANVQDEMGKVATQVAYTYAINQPNSDYSKITKRMLIEVNMDVFNQLAPREKVLSVLHEFAHHDSKLLTHDLIYPYIKALNTVLNVRERQLKNDWSPISREEYLASKTLCNLQLGDYKGNGDRYYVHPLYGGLIEGVAPQTKELYDQINSNRIGISSNLQKFYPDRVDFRSNTMVDSLVRMFYPETEEEEKQKRQNIHSNLFFNTYLVAEGLGSSNSIKNSDIIFLKLGSKNKIENVEGLRLSIENNNFIKNVSFPDGSNDHLIGSYNIVEDTTFVDQKIYEFKFSLKHLDVSTYAGLRHDSPYSSMIEKTKLNRSIIRNSRLSLVKSFAPVVIENVVLSDGIYLFSKAKKVQSLRNLVLTYNEKVVHPKTAGLILLFQDGDNTYNYSPYTTIDMTRALQAQKVKLDGKSYDSQVIVPTLKISKKEQLDKALGLK